MESELKKSGIICGEVGISDTYVDDFKVKKVIKRDGEEVKYDRNKIYEAILKAARSVKMDDSLAKQLSKEITQEVENEIKGNVEIQVEQIQDIIEKRLIKRDIHILIQSFMNYRYRKALERGSDKKILRTVNSIINKKEESRNILKENANIDDNTAMATMLKIASESTKEYAKNSMLKKVHAKAHDRGDIHIHDLDFLATGTATCCQIDIEKLFKGGFNTGHGFVREPQDISSYSALAAIAIQSNQNDQHGGQSIPNFDYGLEPGIKKTFVTELSNELVSSIDEKYELSEEELECLREEFKERLKGYSFSSDRTDFANYLYEKYNNETYKSIRKLLDRAWRRAYRNTDRKCKQAMEAFIHNLNTMHCLPYSEELWVYDVKENNLKAMSIGELTNQFEVNRYQVISINPRTGKSELKYVNGAQKKDNNRRLIKITNRCGQTVTTTDNHGIMTLDSGLRIDQGYPENITHTLSPKNIELPFIGSKIYLDKFTSRKTQNYTKDYIEVNSDLSELLGYYVADGSLIGEGTLCFTVCDETIENELIQLMIKVYGENVTWTRVKRDGDKPKDIRFNVGKVFGLTIKDICGGTSRTKKIPLEILTGSDEIKKKFLKGYLRCDGSIKNYVVATTSSKVLRDQLNLMLLSLGEIPYIKDRLVKGGFSDEHREQYEISITGKAENRLNLGLGIESAFEIPKYDYSMFYKEFNSKLRGITRRKSKNIYSHELEEYTNKLVEYNYVNNFYPVEVVSKEEGNSGEEYVYDISVEDNENFLTVNGIFVHNSRAGAQVPFSSINYGTSTTEEGRMIIKNILLAIEAGLGNGETAIFPISVFKVKEGVNYNPEDPNYDLFKLAVRVSAKRLFPNFVFLDAPFNLQYYKKGVPSSEVVTMGCRTRVMGSIFEEYDGYAFGRGNISFTSINLPRLGIESKGNWNVFFELLENIFNLVADQLYDRFEFQGKKKVKNFPFLMGQGVWSGSENLGSEDELKEVLRRNGTLGVGFIGLAETLKVMTGKHHGESEESQRIGLKVLKFLRDLCDKESQKRQVNYTLLATPAEGLSGRFVSIDRDKYGEIPGVTDREYYTNSFHIPVHFKISMHKKIVTEAPYHELCNAGHITYVELDGSAKTNLEAFEGILRLMKESNIGYGSINHPVDRDPVCGYTGVIDDICPKCLRKANEGVPIERIRRITGYLVGTMDKWNDAKISEEKNRVKHV